MRRGPPSRRRGCWAWLLLVVRGAPRGGMSVLTVGFAVMLAVLMTFRHEPRCLTLDALPHEPVERRAWEPGLKLDTVQRPVIFEGAPPTNEWAAMDRWTVPFLARVWQHGVPAQRQRRDRVFATWHDNKPLEGELRADIREAGVATNELHRVDLLRDLLNASSAGDHHHYFTCNLETATALAGGKHDFGADVDAEAFFASDKGRQANVWVGSGIVTAMHYDVSYNAFVQVRGEKTFYFWPPEAQAYPYPVLHPHQAHSQVGARLLASRADPQSGVCESEFPLLFTGEEVAPLLVGKLKRGDFLVVPPLWWHQVVTPTTTVSVSANVWSDARDLDRMDAVYRLAIPLDEGLDARAMTLAVRSLLARLEQALEMPGLLLERVWKSRYQPVIGQLVERPGKRKRMQEWCGGAASQHRDDDDEEEVRAFVAELKRRFTELDAPQSAVLAVFVPNYSEQLVNAVLGTESVASFFEFCVSSL